MSESLHRLLDISDSSAHRDDDERSEKEEVKVAELGLFIEIYRQLT